MTCASDKLTCQNIMMSCAKDINLSKFHDVQTAFYVTLWKYRDDMCTIMLKYRDDLCKEYANLSKYHDDLCRQHVNLSKNRDDLCKRQFSCIMLTCQNALFTCQSIMITCTNTMLYGSLYVPPLWRHEVVFLDLLNTTSRQNYDDKFIYTMSFWQNICHHVDIRHPDFHT
jgi:hypothetical protein